MIFRFGHILLLALLLALAYRLFPVAREVLDSSWGFVQSAWHMLRTAK